jgi:hypothetical protein
VTLCAVCTVHMEMRSTHFLVEPQNQGARFVSGLASKPLGRVVNGLASKSLGWFVSGLASKPLGRFVSGLASKPLGWASCLGLKTDSYGLVIWSSKSPRCFFGLSFKTKQALVCWLHYKTDVRMKTACGTHRDLAGCFAWK